MLLITSRLTTTPNDFYYNYVSISTTLTCLLHNAIQIVHTTVSPCNCCFYCPSSTLTFWSPVKLGRSLGTKHINSIGPRCECVVPGNEIILALMTKLTLNM